MSLVKYKQKRSFTSTPEPAGGKAIANTLKFVIQKHAASHLHYDFRLEMEGVLKSWAVPKGPSLDPAIKRLAMMVEDHPYDYRNFEGTIPEGNYGAGSVIIWDEGNYLPSEGGITEKAAADRDMRRQLHTGKLKFVLNGTKLKGEFVLIKSKGRGENAWLLMKIKDEYATSQDILLQETSVVSGNTVEQIGDVKKTSSKKDITAAKAKKSSTPPKKKAPAKKKAQEKVNDPATDAVVVHAPDGAFFSSLSPMLATLVDKAVEGANWIYEIKWDGYRAVAFKNGDTLEVKSRNDNSFDKKFYPIHNALKEWKENAVIDGEIVALKDNGLPDFGTLQNWRSEADGPLLYYVFDILWLNGKDLRELPLLKRREILQSVLPQHESIRFSDAFSISGSDFLASVREMGMEGIIAKKAGSPYQSGVRTRDWLKIKASKRNEVVIAGFTKNENTSKPFSALLVGVYDGENLIYTGKIGTGFKDKLQREMLESFKPLITDQCPFDSAPDYNKPSRFNPRPPKADATWLKPKLVCEVAYAEITSDGIMRHSSFQGMRIDKDAKTVTQEIAVPTSEAVSDNEATSNKVIPKVVAKTSRDRKTFLNPTDETQVREIDGHTMKFTNLSKFYWPEDKVTKRDMLNYYYQIAPYLITYLKDRPQSLNRFPNGIHGKSFYQKDVTGKVPDWVQTYLYHSNDEEVDKHFMVPQSDSDILLMASLGCIELNPWSSTIHKPDHPDWCIIDLDPDKNSFDQVIQAAQVTHTILENIKVPSYCKTSGSTGLHIYIPLGAQYTYEQSKELARAIVTQVHHELPKFTSIERKVAHRDGKMYLDFLQNRPKATLAAPYSLRPKPGATVSMPLDWSEVKKGLKMSDFNIHNAVARVREMGDIFKPVLGKGITL
ncbi:MAG: DNA ligase D [Chryseolinea sp.]